MIILNPNLKKYIDEKGLSLLKLISHEINLTPISTNPKPPELKGYLKHKEVINLGEVIGNLDISQEGLDGKLKLKIRNFANEKIGFKEDGFLEIHNLVRSFVKDQFLQKSVSEKFLVDKIFDGIVINFQDGKSLFSISDFVLEQCEKNIMEFRIFFPVLYLETNKPFDLGKVNFKYISSDYIIKLASFVKEELRENYIKALEQYKGQLMASCVHKAEKGKAIELAFTDVSLAVDCLKILSPAVDYPQIKIFFDIDSRNIYQRKTDVLVQKITQEEIINPEYIFKNNPFVIDTSIWNSMLKNKLGLFHTLLLKISNDYQSELEHLTLNGIRNFSKAIGNNDQHARIAQIFTVLESLLLPSETANILESVCKYLPKLVATEPSMRIKISETIRRLYNVRSSMIHHAKLIEFNVDDLSLLQRCTRALLTNFITTSQQKLTKAEILKEIDDRINRA